MAKRHWCSWRGMIVCLSLRWSSPLAWRGQPAKETARCHERDAPADETPFATWPGQRAQQRQAKNLGNLFVGANAAVDVLQQDRCCHCENRAHDNSQQQVAHHSWRRGRKWRNRRRKHIRIALRGLAFHAGLVQASENGIVCTLCGI